MRRSLVTRPGGFARLSMIGLLSGTILVLLAFVAAGCSLSGGDSGGSSAGATNGKSAPDFQVTTLAGDQASLSLYRGKPLVLAFMASW